MHLEDVLFYGMQTSLREIAKTPAEDRELPGAAGQWSPKDIIAHLTSFEDMLADLLGSLLEPRPTPVLDFYIRDHEGFNLSTVEQRRPLSWDQVLAEYREAFERSRDLLARIPEDQRRQTGLLPWYGPEYDLEDFLVYSFYGHKREHSAQLAAFRDVRARESGGTV
ncbi:MAG TPA: ClbS/DfsB family four-helix bundle protein [Chloroflexi bacterium]|jgi:hypothetical protein|nr:ClbS/DfsB family four-helix bundle protein [Chloroflexota bacterium]HPO57620.1 DinB family protein [Anaerolineaceae bacterium]